MIVGRWLAYGFVFAAGVALGVALLVRLSFAGTTVSVPGVVGLTQEQARFQATGARLKFQVLSERYDLDAAKGTVVAQDPPAGTSTRRYRTLGVTISKGVDRMPMPDLIGGRMDQAQVRVRQAGLKLGAVAYLHSAAEPQTVVAQAPPAGSVVARESETSLLVSVGPRPPAFVTPSLCGRPFDQARAALRQQGIQMGAARTVKDPSVPPDTVLSQSPPPGSPLSRRDLVHVSVSRP